MPLRIAVPSPTSRLYPVAAEALGTLLGRPIQPHGRALVDSLPDGTRVVYCRGTDVGVLVALGVADVGLTGYDMIAETTAGGRPTPAIHSLAPARTSYVCVLKPEGRTRITRVYTEYPHLTQAWLTHSRTLYGVEVVTLHGSIEGVVAHDNESAGVLLVTSGETARANGLDTCLPLLATDLCLVTRSGQRGFLGGLGGLGGLDIDSLSALELAAFCREIPLHGSLLPRPYRAGTAYAIAQADQGRTATCHALRPHPR
jgi:ATP phosphoribosyltransferase